MGTIDNSYTVVIQNTVENIHNTTKTLFSDVIKDLYDNQDVRHHRKNPIISDLHYRIIMDNAERLNTAIDHSKDFTYNERALNLFQQSYLLKMNGTIVERPQHMLMRVAIGIHGDDIESALETYHLMARKLFTHASPTLRTASTRYPQLSSCFLLSMCDDSTEGIYDTIKQCAIISKYSGGIGLNVHCVRAKGSHIAGINGISNGLLPMLRVFNNVARYIDQGGHKRPGAFAIYLEPWHADIFDFLDMKKVTGKEEIRAKDLYFALWIPDLFMVRVETDQEWSLMCPHDCPGLFESYGEEFEQLYLNYESQKNYLKRIKARTLWQQIIQTQIETGMPYLLFKDASNRKSNQQNIGTIQCSNLCGEVIQYSASNEIGVCNLASIALNMFVGENYKFDFKKLKDLTKIVTKNLNKIIDVTYYPLPEAEISNLRHRPIGIGIQGLADAFILMRLPYESKEAQLLNQQIAETIYYGALEASAELAAIDGPYETYNGSPVSKGILQYDMWNKLPTDLWDWTKLKKNIEKHGIRNSLLIAITPTASTSQILGNAESFEPYTSYFHYNKSNVPVINHHLIRDLSLLGLWNDIIQKEIIAANGSVQQIKNIPDDLKQLYKTVWEISLKQMIQMSVDRAAFIDQSQSFNVYLAEPTYATLTSIFFYQWKSGLKTAMYYLKTT